MKVENSFQFGEEKMKINIEKNYIQLISLNFSFVFDHIDFHPLYNFNFFSRSKNFFKFLKQLEQEVQKYENENK